MDWIDFQHLEDYLGNLDTFLKDKTISPGEYMQICLLLKMWETLRSIDKQR